MEKVDEAALAHALSVIFLNMMFKIKGGIFMSLKFAILTAGNIAGAMARTVSQMKGEGIECYAIAARSLERAKALAYENGFSIAYGSYEALFEDKEVDLVYVASPHSHHYEHAKAALEHGKHVLCEKPMTVNEEQAKELFALAKERGLLLTEATWTRFMPFVPALQEVLKSGVIGDVKTLTCAFGVPVAKKERIAQPELAGGALLDLGIYPLTMAAIALGQPKEICGVCTKTELGVDAQNSISLSYESGAVACLTSGIHAQLDNCAVLYGTRGKIVIDQFWHAEGFTVFPAEGEPKTYSFPHDFTGYEYEVRCAAKAIAEGKTECPELPHEETLHILHQMDTLRKAWNITYPFE